MAKVFFLPKPLLVYTIFFAISYLPIFSLDFNWIIHSLSFWYILKNINKNPLYWIILHLLCFLSMYWIFFPLHYMAGINVYASGIITLIFISILTLIKSYPMYLITKYNYDIIYVGFYWALFEYIQIHYINLPWMPWPQVQGCNPLIDYIFFLPAYLWIIFFIFIFKFAEKFKIKFMPLLLVILIIKHFNYYKYNLPPLSFTIIQGKVDKIFAINKTKKIRFSLHQEHLSHYLNLSKNNKSDLVIWPEGILGSVVNLPLATLDFYVENLRQESNILLGASFNEPGYNNIALLINKNNYFIRQKKHFVPLGEHTPDKIKYFLQPILNIFSNFELENLIPDENYQIFTIEKDEKSYTLLATICYEAAFIPFEKIPKTDLIVILSEHIWFKSYISEYQFLALAQLMAHINHTPVILADNYGLSGWISPDGKIQQLLNRNTTDILEIIWQ